jgi:transcriptional regulator with XRE-family HTH domain
MPTPREQLSEAMRKARLEAGFATHSKFAQRLNMSRPAISRAESPNQPIPSDPLLAAWARACGVPVEEFTEIVARAKNGTLEWFMPYLSAERVATSLRFWEPLLVPGLFQTEAYGRALLSVRRYTAEQLQALLDMRRERQQVIGRAAVTAVIDHRVLAHAIGSPEIMAEQCSHLADLVESGKTRLHVVPEGANIGLGGAHAIASHNGLITVSLTTTMRDITSTAPDVVEETTEAFDLALGASMPAVQSLEFVRTREDIWRARA